MTVEQNFLLWDNHVSAACHVPSLLTFYSLNLTHSLFVLSRALQKTGTHTHLAPNDAKMGGWILQNPSEPPSDR